MIGNWTGKATVKARKEVAYRLALAEGFLAEANQDIKLERWRSCVNNAQLSVENAGKSVLAWFGAVPKTHDPAQQIAALLRTRAFPETVEEILQSMLPDLLALGSAEHFMTDYGDEATYTLPWELFTRESAEEALAAAQHSLQSAHRAIQAIESWQQGQHQQ